MTASAQVFRNIHRECLFNAIIRYAYIYHNSIDSTCLDDRMSRLVKGEMTNKLLGKACCILEARTALRRLFIMLLTKVSNILDTS